MGQIVDYRIVKVTKPDQYAVRFILYGGGRTPLKRLRTASGRIAPTPGINSWKNELPDKHAAIMQAICEQLEYCIKNDSMTPQTHKYKTCADAMIFFIDHYEKTHRDKETRNKAKSFIEFFNTHPLSYLNQATAKTFIEYLIANKNGYHTVRLKIAVASQLISWLIKNGHWHTGNPFNGLLSQYVHKFPAIPPEKSTITDSEHNALVQAATELNCKSALIFIEIARCTGLRKSEIMNLDLRYIDHQENTWAVRVTKTRGKEFYRKIAIPAHLPIFLLNMGCAIAPIDLPNLEKQFDKIRRISNCTDIVEKTFRKDFASRMELAGASPDIINLHQGRGQIGVIYEHYLTDPDRATRVCRPYIDAMFGPKTSLTVVK